jgi:hypothetical protein
VELDVVTRVIRALEREGVAYKVFGAVALIAHGLPRGTQDLDLFVAPDPVNVVRLRTALRSVFDDPSIDEITSEDLSGDYPAIQYVPPTGDFHVDILARLGEAWSYDSLESVRGLWNGEPISVVSPRQLYAMKKDTVRWKDRGDAARLKSHFELED